MSEQEIRDELMTLLIAGHETTATTLAWAFQQLVRERAVLDRLVAEIDAGEDDAYLTATIRETLRHRPVLPNVAPRFVAKQVAVGDWTYEPGCALVANAYLVHHDAEIYPEPYAFRPERFLDPLRRRPPPLPRRQLRDAGAEGRLPRPARQLRAARLRRGHRGRAAAQHHRAARPRRPGGAGRPRTGAGGRLTGRRYHRAFVPRESPWREPLA